MIICEAWFPEKKIPMWLAILGAIYLPLNEVCHPFSAPVSAGKPRWGRPKNHLRSCTKWYQPHPAKAKGARSGLAHV